MPSTRSTSAASPIDAVLNALRSQDLGPKRQGSNWRARCPSHDDRNPSLSISVGGDDRVLLKCHAGCSGQAVVAALRLTEADLFVRPKAEPEPGKAVGSKRERDRVKYEVCDADGHLLACHIRREYSDGTKDFVWERGGKSGLHGLKQAALPLYGTELLVERPDETVIVCEGEKAALGARKHGFLALGTYGANVCPQRSVLESLRGRVVCLWPDNDEAGRQHMSALASRLKGIASRIAVVSWPPGMPERSDAADVSAEQMESLVSSAQSHSPAGSFVGGNESAWEMPVPFESIEVPTFPLEELPAAIGEFVDAEADATQTPADLTAVLALAAIGAVVSRSVIVQVPGYREPLNLYAAVALPPGNRKSAVVRDVVRPLFRIEGEVASRLAVEVLQARTRFEVQENLVTKLKRQAGNAKEHAKREELTSQAEAEAVKLGAMRVPDVPRLVAQDFSPEKLPGLLSAGGGKIAVFDSEGGIFDTLAGRYSDGIPNLDGFLKAWSGDEIRVDRVKRGSEHVVAPALSLGLAVQPDVIRGLQAKPGFRGRGLVGRFLYSFPKSRLGGRTYSCLGVPEPLIAQYEATLMTLATIPTRSDELGRPDPFVLSPTPEADAVSKEFFDWLEPQLGPGGSLLVIQDWASKLHGTMLRLAGVLHMAANPSEPGITKISPSTMTSAVRLARDYFLPHALEAFAVMGSDPVVENAKAVLEWIRSQRVLTFSKRDAQRAVNRIRESEATAAKALEVLVSRGYVRERDAERRDSRNFECNPAIWSPSPSVTASQTSTVTSVTTVRRSFDGIPDVPPSSQPLSQPLEHGDTRDTRPQQRSDGAPETGDVPANGPPRVEAQDAEACGDEDDAPSPLRRRFLELRATAARRAVLS